jgi:hypothetical protein
MAKKKELSQEEIQLVSALDNIEEQLRVSIVNDPSGETIINSLATVIEDDLRPKVRALRDKGFDINTIAATLMIRKARVQELLN